MVWYQPQGRCTRAGVVASGRPSASSSRDERLHLLRPVDRRDQHRVGGVDDARPLDPEHAEQPPVRAQVAVAARRAHARCPRAPTPRRVLRGLCSQTAFQSPMSDQSKSAGDAPRARAVCSITAWSKLIFGAVGEARAEPQRAEVDARPRRAPARTASSASGASARDLAQARVGAEAEHAGVPEAALGRSARAARPASGFSTKRATACAPAGSAAAGLDVAVGRRRPGRRAPRRTTIRPSRGQPRRRRAAAREGGGVGDQMVGRQHQHDGAGVAPRREAGGRASPPPACRAASARARSRSSTPVSRACSATRNRDAGAALITIGVGEAPRRPAAASVRWNGEAPPRIATCCLAKSLRDTGQSRDPDPPHRTTGTNAIVNSPAPRHRSRLARAVKAPAAGRRLPGCFHDGPEVSSAKGRAVSARAPP